MQERRKSHRSRTYLGGRIAFNQRASTMDCLVRNLSSDGARVVFTNTLTVPDEFDLTITRKAESYRARMVWRQPGEGDAPGEAGIVFLEPRAEAAPIPLDVARRLKKCEAERDALKRRVAQLSAPA